MSTAWLNYNARAYVPWKGKTFNQIISVVQRNNANYPYINKGSTPAIFLPPPLKIYRREVASTKADNCNSYISSSIDVFNQPGGSIVNSAASTSNQKGLGIMNTLDFNLTNNTYERPGTCSGLTSNGVCLDVATNARARVRSSGMIKKKYDTTKNNDTYYTSANQYLVSRNRTFLQNQYNYIRQGQPNAKPGTPLTVQNVYATNTPSHCQTYVLVSPTSFVYQWLDAVYYTVTVPAGSYTVDDLNQVFQDVMIANQHYYILNSNQTKTFLLNFAYVADSNKIQLQCFATDRNKFPPATYSLPVGASWRTPNYTIVPVFVILNNVFQQMIGFSGSNAKIYYSPPENTSLFKYALQYPAQEIRYLPVGQSQSYVYQYIGVNGVGQILYQTPAYMTNQFFNSPNFAGLQRNYVPVYYKPNNSQFAQQGGVSGSSYITRLKYNTITNNTVKYQQAYGNNVANAMAYGVADSVYTIKDKMGYPNKCTPTFLTNAVPGDTTNNCGKLFNG
jgi:hypothetical protein